MQGQYSQMYILKLASRKDLMQFLLQTFLEQRGEDYDDCKSYDNLVR